MFLRKKNLFNKKEDFYNKITDYFTSINIWIILYQSLNTK